MTMILEMELGTNYIYEFVMLWVMFIFKKILEFEHVGPRVDFIDFSSGVGDCYKLIYYEY